MQGLVTSAKESTKQACKFDEAKLSSCPNTADLDLPARRSVMRAIPCGDRDTVSIARCWSGIKPCSISGRCPAHPLPTSDVRAATPSARAMAGVNPELLPLLANVEQLASDAYVVRYVTGALQRSSSRPVATSLIVMCTARPVASLVLALYDGLVLFPLELRHIWLARNSVAKWAYLANRYVSFGGIALLVHGEYPTCVTRTRKPTTAACAGTGALHWGNVSDT